MVSSCITPLDSGLSPRPTLHASLRLTFPVRSERECARVEALFSCLLSAAATTLTLLEAVSFALYSTSLSVLGPPDAEHGPPLVRVYCIKHMYTNPHIVLMLILIDGSVYLCLSKAMIVAFPNHHHCSASPLSQIATHPRRLRRRSCSRCRRTLLRHKSGPCLAGRPSPPCAFPPGLAPVPYPNRSSLSPPSCQRFSSSRAL